MTALPLPFLSTFFLLSPSGWTIVPYPSAGAGFHFETAVGSIVESEKAARISREARGPGERE
jgi:hypothetical protein